MPTNSIRGGPASLWKTQLIRSSIFFGALALLLAGCQGNAGSGHRNLTVGELKAGAEARLVSPDGSEITLDSLVGSASKKPSSGRSAAGKAEKIKLPAGTTVLIREIVGDDAHVVIKDGPRVGANCWVETVRLEPLAN